METVFSICFAILSLALILVFYRLVYGPHPVDRILCLDFLSLISAGMIAVNSLWVDDPIYLDGVLVLSIIAFIATIVFARFVESKRKVL